MATIQRPVKTYGTRSYAAEVAAAPGNEDPVLAVEVDGDLDTIYAAWNGGADTVNLKDGSVTFVKLAADAQLWRDTGTALTPGVNFAARPVAITGATNNPLIFGSRTIKGRLVAQTTSDRTILNANASLNAAETAWTQDDAAKASWFVSLRPDTDQFLLQRTPPAGVITNLLTVDSGGRVTIPGPTSGDNTQIVLGVATFKGRLLSLIGQSWVGVTANDWYDGAWHQDDTTKPSWHVVAYPTGDQFVVERRAANNGAMTSPLAIGSGGDLTILGATAVKASGTTWANPSDRRLKDEIEDYATGLAAILQLQPRTFVFNGKGGSMAGLRGYGFIADEIAPVLPETVGLRAGKLDPDDEDETEIQTLDTSNITLALVNAVKELAARVTALETQ